MPREVKAFACKFKCGRKVTTHADSMARHEAEFCRNNPALKACPTCEHDSENWIEGEWEMIRDRYCEIEKRALDGPQFIRECEHWKGKEPVL